MNILFLTRLYSPHIGGVERHVKRLSEELTKQGHLVTILTEQFNTELPLTEKKNEIVIYRIPFRAINSKLGIWKRIFLKISIFLNANIIHIHDVFWWMIPLLPILLFKKVFITFHGYEGSEPPNAKQIFWHRLAAKLTHGNICIGDFHEKWYGVKPTIVSYGAVDFPSTQMKITGKDIVFVGRLSEDTGILDYLQAFRLIASKSKHNLHIYGDGELRNRCEQFVEDHHLTKRIFLYGFVNQLVTNISKAKIAYVSRYLAILESLAAGIPIVAHYNSGIKHDYLRLAPFARWISVVHSPEEIAAATMHPAPISVDAKKWITQQTWNKLTNDYLTLWQS